MEGSGRRAPAPDKVASESSASENERDERKKGNAMTHSTVRGKSWTQVSLLVGIALMLTAALANAELKPWDQENVTALAGELHRKTKDMRAAVRRVPPPTLGQPGQRAFHRLRDELGAIEATARRLHKALADGATREESFPTYRRLIRAVRNASEEVPRLGGGRDAAPKLASAAEVLRQLRQYYEEEPPL